MQDNPSIKIINANFQSFISRTLYYRYIAQVHKTHVTTELTTNNVSTKTEFPSTNNRHSNTVYIIDGTFVQQNTMQSCQRKTEIQINSRQNSHRPFFFLIDL